MGLTGNPIGRPTKEVVYHVVGEYVIGQVSHKSDHVRFIFDVDCFENVRKYNWYVCCGYIGTRVSSKILYLHNLVMDKITFDGRGQKETVDHINRNPLDNRKCNLRIVTQSQQNMNQKKKSRRVVLPIEYTLNPNDFPKHVRYVPARGNHGDGFCVEFKLNGKKIYNPYIRSKVLSIEEKLEKIKVLLQKGYELYPEFNPEYEMTLRDRLNREYEFIVSSCTPASSSPNTESHPSFLPGHVESNLKN